MFVVWSSVELVGVEGRCVGAVGEATEAADEDDRDKGEEGDAEDCGRHVTYMTIVLSGRYTDIVEVLWVEWRFK